MLEILNAYIGMPMWSILDVESFNNFITSLSWFFSFSL